jgi:hypothetical protein
MTFEVQLESWPRSQDHPNEDWVAAADDVVVVLDGAGIPKRLPTGCIHSVAWFVQHLGPALMDQARDRKRSLISALESAIIEVRALHDHQCDLSHPNSPSSTVVMLRLNDALVESLVLADSTLVVAGANHKITTICDDRLQRLEDRLAAEGQPTSSSALSEYRNQPGGFWVAGTKPEAATQALANSWAVDSLRALALLTDGAARYVDMFEVAPWQELMSQLEAHGPEAILERVREQEASDPDRRRWKRRKPYDDATIAYVRL